MKAYQENKSSRENKIVVRWKHLKERRGKVWRNRHHTNQTNSVASVKSQ
jgi:hypothetical protein